MNSQAVIHYWVLYVFTLVLTIITKLKLLYFQREVERERNKQAKMGKWGHLDMTNGNENWFNHFEEQICNPW